jgi:hypothetical protein
MDQGDRENQMNPIEMTTENAPLPKYRYCGPCASLDLWMLETTFWRERATAQRDWRRSTELFVHIDKLAADVASEVAIKQDAAEIAPGPAKFRSKVLAKIERRCVRCASEGGSYYRRARDLGLGAVIVCVLTIVLWAGIITGLNMAIRMAGGAH